MITLTDSPDPRFETILEEGLAEYNAEKVGGRDWRALAVTVHDPDTGEPAGGLLGRTSMGLFFLDLFYLPAKLRGGGIGGRALRMAEEEAVGAAAERPRWSPSTSRRRSSMRATAGRNSAGSPAHPAWSGSSCARRSELSPGQSGEGGQGGFACHCEERSDAAISIAVRNGMGIASLRSQ